MINSSCLANKERRQEEDNHNRTQSQLLNNYIGPVAFIIHYCYIASLKYILLFVKEIIFYALWNCSNKLGLSWYGMDIPYEVKRYLRWPEPRLMTNSWPSFSPQAVSANQELVHIQPKRVHIEPKCDQYAQNNRVGLDTIQN